MAFSSLFSWGSAAGEIMALVVGFNALQALKCCCCPDRCADRSFLVGPTQWLLSSMRDVGRGGQGG